MYHHLSRSLYRQLAPLLVEYGVRCELGHSRRRLLDACEMTMKRLATDPDYFAHPPKFLFTEIRPLFPISSQLQVRRIVDRALAEAGAALEVQRALLINRECAALTRQGTHCQRHPVGNAKYCPSHRHLEFELERVVA
jgi:hypothetical protein